MARNAHIHTVTTPRHATLGQVAARRAFEASIAAAKRRAQRTGEDLGQLLDRMDAADPRTCGAQNLLISGDYGATVKGQRARSWFAADRRAGLVWTGGEPDAPDLRTA